jgi:transcriptional regulator GlxA family with amidase domain
MNLEVKLYTALLKGSIRSCSRIEEAAENLLVSPRSLTRALRKAGTTYVEIITHFRVGKAKALLTNTQKPIEKISVLVGFRSRRSLERIFTKVVGISASKYRDKSREATLKKVTDRFVVERLKKTVPEPVVKTGAQKIAKLDLGTPGFKSAADAKRRANYFR